MEGSKTVGDMLASRRHGAPAPAWMQREAAKLIRTHQLSDAASLVGIGEDALMRIATGANVMPTTIALAEINLKKTTAEGSSR